MALPILPFVCLVAPRLDYTAASSHPIYTLTGVLPHGAHVRLMYVTEEVASAAGCLWLLARREEHRQKIAKHLPALKTLLESDNQDAKTWCACPALLNLTAVGGTWGWLIGMQATVQPSYQIGLFSPCGSIIRTLLDMLSHRVHAGLECQCDPVCCLFVMLGFVE